MLPLFHEVDYRLLSPRWVGLHLSSRAPYVDYTRLARRAREPMRTEAGHGELRVAVPSMLEVLDPAAGSYLEHHELVHSFVSALAPDRDVECTAHLVAEGEGSGVGEGQLGLDRVEEVRRLVGRYSSPTCETSVSRSVRSGQSSLRPRCCARTHGGRHAHEAAQNAVAPRRIRSNNHDG